MSFILAAAAEPALPQQPHSPGRGKAADVAHGAWLAEVELGGLTGAGRVYWGAETLRERALLFELRQGDHKERWK